ncbi:hypothetical protein [Lactobacillus sp. Sy-1]|uniref:hypothetical protein n=1 Tax=Lactobacillus sp. Sy-1 TaxID=2109645 RepID=UPI001C59C0C4|nr:hypothetical protein [Lactobacillus sp. Sy-1]MBW1604786.1 hypothetical protein [Lactobacillus sp. Sy-1]
MPFILSERFLIRTSKLILIDEINNNLTNYRTFSVLVNPEYNYSPYIQDLIYGYIIMGNINKDIVKEFMPSEDCAARTINEYLSKNKFVNKAKEEYIRNGQNRC